LQEIFVWDNAVITIELTATLVVLDGEVPQEFEAVTEYVPTAAVVAEGILGFWLDEANPLGPDHE
jgi:hypothetical protein